MYVFRMLKTSGWPTDANDAAQAKTINAYWVAFAKTGDPNGGERPLWPRYGRTRDEILDFTNGGPVVARPPRRKGIEAISRLYR